MGVFKLLILTRPELAVYNRLFPDTFRCMHTTRMNAYPKTVSIIKMQHTCRAQGCRETDKFYRVSYFITPFNQNGIYELE